MVAILVKDGSLYNQYYGKIEKTLHIFISIAILLSIILLLWRIPLWQVSQYQLNNTMEQATLENQFRTTLAQILGGGAVAIGIYFAWKNVKVAQATLATNEKNAQENLKLAQDTLESSMKNAQENLKIAQDSQITERFTRAVDQLGATDQLGNPAIEIRLGGIYALERIANESEKDYWSIMEILTAYVRKNSIIEAEKLDARSSAVQAILQVIRRRKYSLKDKETHGLDFNSTCLIEANLKGANLERADFELVNFAMANLDGAILKGADLRFTNFGMAHLEGADLEGADLGGARNLTIEQLSKVKSLYKAKLYKELEIELKEKYPALFEKPKE